MILYDSKEKFEAVKEYLDENQYIYTYTESCGQYIIKIEDWN